MRTLSIDIETYSSIELTESGVYRYAEAPDFGILLFAYAFDDEPVEIIDFVANEYGTGTLDTVEAIKEALTDPKICKTAFNANFERTCLSRFFKIQLPVEQWECTMAHALMLGLPGSLEKTAEVLKLEQQKLAGKSLINYFSKPCKPTKVNGQRTRNYPEQDPQKWDEFKRYCAQDVVVERAIKQRIAFYHVPDFERKLWQLDQKINDLGVRIDVAMVDHALACNAYTMEKLTAAAQSLTGLENPNSVAQLKRWVEARTGQALKSLDKAAVQELLNTSEDETLKKALRLRVQLAKTSTAKYSAMTDAAGADGRIRGLLQYYGANRTGRWAGRLVQVQNLPQNHLPDLDAARQILLSGDYEMLELLYGNTPDVLSQLIRTAFMPSPGNHLVVADFSAIEARVIAWLAGEKWRLEVFRTHGKIYEASAAQMFRVPLESINKGSPLRQKGKVAELALGYQGSVGALIQMGALIMGLTEAELPELVETWRAANPRIVRLWRTVEAAAIKAIEEKTTTAIQHDVKFIYEKGILFIQLPSGRRLSYLKANVQTGGQWNRKYIAYEGMNQTTRKWEQTETYGGKLVENIVQATARDCLAEAMLGVDAAGYNIVMTVHDEIVIDAPMQKDTLDEVNAIMGRELPWARGLPLTADGYETSYYRKD